MGDLIRYPQMATVKAAAETYGLPPTYIRPSAGQAKSGTLWLVIAGWSIWTAWPSGASAG